MAKSPKEQNFETALAELEKIVSGMESGQLPLEDALAAYQRGTALLKFCQQKLSDAEQQVRVLNEAHQLDVFPAADN